jgi:hypothetical protein
MAELPFDAVAIEEGEGVRVVSALHFIALPLNERIRLILERRVEFRKAGQAIERTVGLKSLMDTGRSPSS